MGEKFYYIDPHGIQYLLNDDVYTFFLEEDGFGLDGLEVIEERTPYLHGADAKGLYLPPRELLIVLAVKDDSAVLWQARDNAFLRAVLPFKDETALGILRRVTLDGRTRDIGAWLVGYSKASGQKDGPAFARRVLKFHCPDPFFYDPEVHEQSISLPAGGGFSFPLSWPVSFSATDINGYIYPNNEGDVKTYPIVRIYGPCDDPTVENETVGKKVAITQAQDTGDYIEIDMGEATVVFYDASAGTTTSILEYMSADSEFWALERGVNVVHVTAKNAVTGSIVLSWYNRYASV